MAHNDNPVRRWAWTRERALLLAALCLAAGIGGGWLIRGWSGTWVSKTGAAKPVEAPQAQAAPAPPQMTPEEALKLAADQQAAPLLARLKDDPANAEILTNLGNLYFDAKQYPAAADYYERALRLKPADANVRTDMATAYWFMGRTDQALGEFDKALGYAPTSANALFNRGLVRWKGKADGKGAMADFQKLLSLYPNYEAKDQAAQFENEIRQQGAAK